MHPKVLIVLCLAVLLLACGGDRPASTPCCGVDDVVKMLENKVQEDTIVQTIQGGQRPASLSADDVIRLTQAGASPGVIDALAGRASAPTPEAGTEAPSPEPSPAATAEATPTVPSLDLQVTYKHGDKSIVVTNFSRSPYTGVTLTANGEYVYILPVPLKPGDRDRMRLSSFKSRRTGKKLDDDLGIQRLTVEASQGRWSKKF
jgi:hypothetical protein